MASGATILGPDVIAERLGEISTKWRCETHDGTAMLVREIRTSWNEAAQLGAAISWLSQRVNHHPQLVQDYAMLTIRLFSHDVGGVTERDLSLATHIERFLAAGRVQ